MLLIDNREPESVQRHRLYLSLRCQLEHQLTRMGFNAGSTTEQIPIQAFWTALEAVVGSLVSRSNNATNR